MEQDHKISIATTNAMRDVGIKDANFLGHSTPVMTQRYAHLRPGHLRRAVGALDKRLRE